MTYNREELPQFSKTAGKISIIAAVIGVFAFLFALMVDVGHQELQRVSAQTATTSLTVLNTPPVFTQNAYEVTESSTTTPTNSGDVIQWTALGTDSNGAPYFLLVCSTNASPTANAAPDNLNLGTAPPECGGGAQWGVSTSTVSGQRAYVSTTTVEVADNAGTQFDEVNNWYAWVCDDDPVQPACSALPTQGISATNSAPFNMNQRPVLTNFFNNGGVDPGGVLDFLSTSTDPDLAGGADGLTLVVCQTNDSFSSSTDTCASGFLASTTLPYPTVNATATYTLAPVVRDGTYPAYGYLVDEHGHNATAIISQGFDVNNVAPTIAGGDIDLNGGLDIALTVPGGETTGFTLDFTLSDANSCINSGGATSSEIIGYDVSIYRSSFSAACDPDAPTYNPNNCYPSSLATTTWNLTCTASTTSCTGTTDPTQLFECSFPLWFVADPTDPDPDTPASFAADNWVAEVRGADDQYATGTSATNTSQLVEVLQFTALNLLDGEIPYGSLTPGENTGSLGTSTTVENVGNTGLDQEVDGESMCGTFTATNTCAVNASSTIPAYEQQFASTSILYDDPIVKVLSSSTPTEADIDVNKTTSTSSPTTGDTFWGIEVPLSITVAGSYQGLNTFYALTASSTAW